MGDHSVERSLPGYMVSIEQVREHLLTHPRRLQFANGKVHGNVAQH
jgi:hypothetical protein